MKLKAIGMPRKAESVRWTPFSPDVPTRILEAAESSGVRRSWSSSCSLQGLRLLDDAIMHR